MIVYVMPAELWLDGGDQAETTCGDELESLATSCLLMLSVPTVAADKQPKKEDKTGCL